jgi:hypothetical protein
MSLDISDTPPMKCRRGGLPRGDKSGSASQHRCRVSPLESTTYVFLEIFRRGGHRMVSLLGRGAAGAWVWAKLGQSPARLGLKYVELTVECAVSRLESTTYNSKSLDVCEFLCEIGQDPTGSGRVGSDRSGSETSRRKAIGHCGHSTCLNVQTPVFD